MFKCIFLRKTFYTWSIFLPSIFLYSLHNCLAIHPFLFGKGFALKDWVVVKIDADELLKRINQAVTEREMVQSALTDGDYYSHSYVESEKEEAKEKKVNSS